MKNEPVAWTNKDELAKYRPIIAEKEYSIHFPIPLYTHPVKELTLTDDEVEEFEWVLKKHFNFPTNEKVPNLDRIIRAILRKAKE